jgi:hypothetical protein
MIIAKLIKNEKKLLLENLKDINYAKKKIKRKS